MPEKMAFAVAGYGAWGRFHAKSIAGAADGRLAAIVAPSEVNARAAKADYPDAVIYRRWEEAIADPAIEAVAVAAPNHLHAPIAIAALNAGKHVLLEKPMANTLEDCDRIVASAKASKAQITIGLQCRLSPQWGRIRALIEEGAIGAPRHVHVSLFRHPYRQGSAGWRYDKSRVGSWILEEPVHFFDLALWYLAASGRPVEVRALGAGEPGMQATISTLMHFPDGATAAVNQILGGFEHHQTVEVVGSKGAIRSTWSAATARSLKSATTLRLKRAGAESFEELPVGRSGEVYELARQAQAAIEGFRAGKSLVSAEEGRAAVAVCLAAEASAAMAGKTIVVD
ncbi:MAG: Gfo/Idh/MocA family oxidoreductase [Hyphomicrobiaceae bacterium]|nr:MAG: Gfo/Idh/MocA family oxidoreductase [Hyphomicrobiaceae bacterium]